jgi:membrane protein
MRAQRRKGNGKPARGSTPRRRLKARTLIAWAGVIVRLALAYRKIMQAQTQAARNLRPAGATPRMQPGSASAPTNGRAAAAPQDIPPRGWWQVAKRVATKFSENELMAEAAGCTFYALLSLFPAITAIVSIYGLFADRGKIEGQLDSVSSFLPSGGVDIIREQVHRLVESPASGLSAGAIIGLLTALWSANAGTKAMFSALNDVYGEREERGFLRVTLTSLVFTLGGITFLVAALGGIATLPLLFRALGMDTVFTVAAEYGRWPVILAIMVFALAILYRFGPSRRLAKWRWVTWGGVIGAVCWVGLSVGFSWYVAHFGSYNKTYGSLGAIIGFMTWIWLSTTVLLVGAQINAELEAQTATDSTVGKPRPLGTRGAASANVVST